MFATLGYNLIINTKTGEQIKLATEDIVDMIFEEEAAPDPVQLATPVVTAKVNGTIVNISWDAVPNASQYRYVVDKGQEKIVNKTSVSLPAEVGTHTIAVQAVGDGELYLDSEAGTASYTYSNYFVEVNVSDVTATSIKASFAPSSTVFSYYVAAIPASQVSNDASIISYFKAKDFEAHTGAYTLTATDLQASTDYVVAAYVADNEVVFKKTARTESDQTFEPGDSGSVFAYGCDRNSGWYDVDKIYNNASSIWPGATDGLMCWACSTAGTLQWWMDEYKKEFGSLPEMRYVIPETSQYYSAPMMEIMVSTFPDDAYDARKAYEWFFIPINNPAGYTNNEHPLFKEDSPYKYGGFIPRDRAFVDAYSKKYTAWELFPTSDSADKIEETFNNLIFDLLAEGAVEITVNKGIHSLMLWGVDYVVKPNGKRSVIRLYIAENGSNTNRINDLESVAVSYVKGDVALSNGYNNLTSLTVLRSPRVVKLP